MTQVFAQAEREPQGPTPRKRLTVAERCTILDRQHDLCAGCAETLVWTVVDGKSVYGPMIDEHIIPLELGGSNDLKNRELRCVPCAKQKTNRPRAADAPEGPGRVSRGQAEDQRARLSAALGRMSEPMTSNPTSEGLVERLRKPADHVHRVSTDQVLLSEAADRIEALEGERDEARKVVVDCNNSLFGSQGYFVSEQAAAIENLKRYGREQWRRAEASEALVTSLRNQLEGAKEALKGAEPILATLAAGVSYPALDRVRACLAASTLYGLEGDQEVRSSNVSPSPLDATRHSSDLSAEPSGRWRKRPVVVDAWRVQDFASAQQQSDPAKWNAQPPWLRKARLDGRIVTTASTVIVKTVEGDMRAQRRDWIIRGVYGEIYPCKPDIFAATYEPVAPTADPLAAKEWLKRRNAALSPTERQPEPREAHEKPGEDE